ncbi:saccharopine dehydrogenase family protein [Alloprevotella tannerae]|jgi:saccharopine dehydrogenase|uniref:saccharopine dehydrogenase family protein n=1 Tax=Alloprevotella tannerae TaxID=76122 RepID=UPI001EDA1410|nr:saccharopine dehydrogenase family protein [Alloprevotella tannerae]MCG2648713.1 saccharopine dehydrogenase family protein [Alloprevotella tannerae]
MGRVLIIGAGGVATVAAHKVAKNADVFSDIMIASRTQSKCDDIVRAIGNPKIKTAHVDADNIDELVRLFDEFKPDLVMNLALPYQDLTIMEACLRHGCSYLDTANYEPKDEAHFEYSWQWAYKERFEAAGLTAILGCGFDPGVTSIFTAYAAKHHFDEIQYLDIVDCNAGDHHKAFATNFNPEINIREITQKGLFWEDGQWRETEPLEIHKTLNYPNVGPKESYLLHHEELESLVKNYPTIRRARFWMTFGQEYLTHLRVIQNIGMASIKPINYNGMEIVPLQFLKAVLPNPQELGENYEGETSIGCRIRGLKDGKEQTYYIYNNCSHQAAYEETGMQGVSYTTGVPACIGARLFMLGEWKRPGVWNVEEFDPDNFMAELNKQGLPWHEIFNQDLEL